MTKERLMELATGYSKGLAAKDKEIAELNGGIAELNKRLQTVIADRIATIGALKAVEDILRADAADEGPNEANISKFPKKEK